MSLKLKGKLFIFTVWLPCLTGKTLFDPFHMLIHHVPVDSHDVLVLEIFPDHTKQHKCQGHILRVDAGT